MSNETKDQPNQEPDRDDADWGHPTHNMGTLPPTTPPPVVENSVLSPILLVEENRNLAQPTTDASCVFIGPSNSGKTCLLFAIMRACVQPNEGETIQLLFTPKGTETPELLKEFTGNILYNQEIKGSREARDYKFSIQTIGTFIDGGQPISTVSPMVVTDGPGGALFPGSINPNGDLARLAKSPQAAITDSPWKRWMVRQLQVAQTIVICVDANDPLSENFALNLPSLIAESAVETPLCPQATWFQKWFSRWNGQNHQSQPPMIPLLRADRVLLLLTKVDLLTNQFERQGNNSLTSMKPQLAAALDPVELARELLGVHTLNRIHQALKPGAEFAVGVCSSYGFHPLTGQPLADERGIISVLGSQTRQEILNKFLTPFGVRDALVFVTTGYARNRVKKVRPHHLWEERSHKPVVIS